MKVEYKHFIVANNNTYKSNLFSVFCQHKLSMYVIAHLATAVDGTCDTSCLFLTLLPVCQSVRPTYGQFIPLEKPALSVRYSLMKEIWIILSCRLM
jgi:hypothetical protein